MDEAEEVKDTGGTPGADQSADPAPAPREQGPAEPVLVAESDGPVRLDPSKPTTITLRPPQGPSSARRVEPR